MELLFGGLLSVAATFVFNIIFSKWQENKRWDSSRLEALTRASLSSRRASGRLEALAMGEVAIVRKRTRPDEIEKALDTAWYDLEALRILIPEVKMEVAFFQQALLDRLELAYATLEYSEQDSERRHYFQSSGSSDEINSIHEQIVVKSQKRLGISRRL